MMEEIVRPRRAGRGRPAGLWKGVLRAAGECRPHRVFIPQGAERFFYKNTPNL